MPSPENNRIPESLPPPRAVPQPLLKKSELRILGSIILVIGIGVACFILWNAQQPSMELPYADDLSAQDSGKYSRDMEVYSGKLGVLMQSWIRSAKVLGHSEAFALGVAVISITAGTSCFVAAGRRS